MDDKMYVDLILKWDFDDGITQKFNTAFKDIDKWVEKTQKWIKWLSTAAMNINLRSFKKYFDFLRKMITDIIKDSDAYFNTLAQNFDKLLTEREKLYKEYSLEESAYLDPWLQWKLQQYKNLLLSTKLSEVSYYSWIYWWSAEEITATQESLLKNSFKYFWDILEQSNDQQKTDFLNIVQYAKSILWIDEKWIKNILDEANVTEVWDVLKVLFTLVKESNNLSEDQLKKLQDTTSNDENIFQYLTIISNQAEWLLDKFKTFDKAETWKKIIQWLWEDEKYKLATSLWIQVDRARIWEVWYQQWINQQLLWIIKNFSDENFAKLLSKTVDTRKEFKDIFWQDIEDQQKRTEQLDALVKYYSKEQPEYLEYSLNEFNSMLAVLADEQTLKNSNWIKEMVDTINGVSINKWDVIADTIKMYETSLWDLWWKIWIALKDLNDWEKELHNVAIDLTNYRMYQSDSELRANLPVAIDLLGEQSMQSLIWKYTWRQLDQRQLAQFFDLNPWKALDETYKLLQTYKWYLLDISSRSETSKWDVAKAEMFIDAINKIAERINPNAYVVNEKWEQVQYLQVQNFQARAQPNWMATNISNAN